MWQFIFTATFIFIHFLSKNCQLFWNVQHLSKSNSNSFFINVFKIFNATLAAFLDLFIHLFSCDNSILYLFYSLSVIFFLFCVARWNWTYGRIYIVLTSTQKVDNGIPVQSQLNFRESGVLITTWNIGTSFSSSILREVWAKPIIFIRTWLGASFTIFHVEGGGNNIGVWIIKGNME